MAKFSGKIGYIQMIEKKPGYWVENVIERSYYGEDRKSTRLNSSHAT